MIVAGSHSQGLAAELAAVTDHQLAGVTYERFPDGERLVRVEGVDQGNHAVVVAATVSDAAHVELLQLQDAVREAGASEVTTVLPYMGYARQDRAFEAGEPVSARAVARAAPLPDDLADPLFLAPDDGAIDIAGSVADAYGRGETDYFEKTRHSGRDVEIRPGDAAVGGRDIVLVDDIVATGATMSEAVRVLHERGAGRVYAACVHPLLVEGARLRLARAGVAAVVGTDTLEGPASEVSVAPAVAEAL
ncbi:MAG: ribose-phosphate pyrophosphokinase [Halobacteriales archaeon SW_9_67_25]|nr:MAG: ribose-phosphate pyrophosphokinase [Halobacteriales archaeon SW_9_67_25]